jgi:excisionase family DNA binding protein
MTVMTSLHLSIPRRRKYLSTSVIAGRLGVTPRTVRLWAESFQIPAMKVGRQWRIEEGRFEEWLSHKDQPS